MTSMGRLTLNVLLSFAQFEREVTGRASERLVRWRPSPGTVGQWFCALRVRRRKSSPRRQ
ncbi:hypothetical protein [Inquilinus limosus]|uniref:hypothetical protein n=1 Tax=Inquilinus limosus TaxID=171674 RepID=UPI003F5CC726